MSSAAPSIPPRPSRAGNPSSKQDMPLIPPRPQRLSNESRSPSREAYTRSPLNELPAHRAPPTEHQRNLSASYIPERPQSAQLPSIGHEGDEYATLDPTASVSPGFGEQKRSIASDLPMHQPTASVSKDTAKARIETVTRTDSSLAVAAGVGKPYAREDKEPEKHPLRARSSFTRSNLALAGNSRPVSVHERPGSMHDRPDSVHEGENEIGIPEIGLQVPMYPNAGDVQAPSPAPGATPHSAGVGFFNDGSQRHHHRRRSSRQDFNPPGSYGMHGHGLEPRDQFERAWYQKHPDELAKEIHHVYDPGHPRGEWALSSDDLNKLVHNRTDVEAGFGTSANVIGVPTEQVGHLASQQYAAQGHSPKSSISRPTGSRLSSSSHAHAESPLRRSNFPFNESHDHHALETDDEDDHHTAKTPEVRVAAPDHHASKFEGSGYDPPVEDLGPHGGNTSEAGGLIHEKGFGVPILASDELSRYPSREFQLPAVDPQQKHNEEGEYRPHYPVSRRRSEQGSRPGSAHGEPLSRILSQDRHDMSGVGTPLGGIREYEPLFPEDDETSQEKPINKHVRPDLARHHFPSQDIWEDNPESLQYTTTVSTPDLPAQLKQQQEREQEPPASAVFEHPDKEAERKNGNIPSDRAHFLTEETEKFANRNFKPGVLSEIPSRPGVQPRFPSRDIWEDTPDSARYETTVYSAQSDETEITSPMETEDRPTFPKFPGGPVARSQGVSTDSIPSGASPTDKKVPAIPDRPKPSIPARPAARGLPAATETKSKPAVPSRPVGGIGSIKSSFMNDLNSRLQLGPQAVKKEEPKEEEPVEAKPLEDARKSRARGPARRKPVAASENAPETPNSSASSFSFMAPRHLFSINETGDLHGGQSASSSAPAASNTDANAAKRAATTLSAVGAAGDMPDPSISEGALQRHEEVQPAFEAALATNAVRSTSPGKVELPITNKEEPSHATTKEQTVESSTQTGQQDITITNPSGILEKLTTFLGGSAHDEGNVVVREGEHAAGEAEAETSAEKTVPGEWDEGATIE